MPSNIALNPPSPIASMFKKRSSQSMSAMASAASYLSAVSQADARARAHGGTPTSTPALSLSSSVTSSSEDTVLNESDDNADGLALPLNPPTSEQVFDTLHSEFGHCANENYRYTSAHPPGAEVKPFEEKEPPYYILLTTYLSYLILICLGHMRDFLGKRFNPKFYRHLLPYDGHAPLNSDFDSFYTRRLKARIDDCFGHPITGVPGRTLTLLDRTSPDHNLTQVFTGTKTRALNISSYNYLGFAQARGGCADVVEEGMRRYGVSTCGARLEGGTSELHLAAEALVASFVGQEDALISSMGFATNSTIIPALVGKGCLVISDELNHASIRFGVRLSGANVRMFKHNNMESLETLLREVISQGQPKTHRPWKKILVIVEGLYSMEGTMVNLPVLLELKKKYKFYVFVDEAHSIGALGPHGRGVADYYNINPREIDILMGTFTKSFGAAGGYISGNKALIDRMRLRGHGGTYAESMTPPVLLQVMASMASIMGVGASPAPTLKHGSRSSDSAVTIRQEMEQYSYPGPAAPSLLPSWLQLPPNMADGSQGRARLRRLAFNSRYLSRGLEKLGFITYGHSDSPIVPLLLFNPGKMAVFARMMRTRATPIVIVVVAYPATPLVTSRVRFCLSAAHTKEDIDIVLRACDEIGDVLDLKHLEGERWPLQRIFDNAVELVNMQE
ncbi:PLP-dependent transferase [Dentipellis sp. KUC8613]|nr:PLP-dependent transferase [Dentipellis sp. KUC8613]